MRYKKQIKPAVTALKDTGIKKTHSSQLEPIPILQAPARDGFDIARWRTAIKQAEDPKEPDRTLLYDIYNDIQCDSHLTAVLEKRIEYIKGCNLVFSENGKENPAITELIQSTWFGDLLGDILSARFWGYTAVWLDLSGGIFQKYKLLNRCHIIPEKGLFVEKRGARTGMDILNPPYSDFILTAGKTDDLGILLRAVPWVLLKRGDVSDWATFNELYASPFRVGTYPAFNQAVKSELEAAVKNSYARAYAILPEGTKLEFIQNNGTGSSSSAYNALADFCDKQLSKLFLHSTMTTDAEGGEYKGDVHERSEQGVHKSDRRFVQNVLNSRLAILLERHGFNPGTGKFVFPEEDHICLKDRLDMDLKLSEKIVIPDEYWYERYNLPVPKGGPKAKQQEANRPAFSEHTSRGFFG